MISAKCTQCGANIMVDDSKEAGICEFCGTAFITEKVIKNYNTTNNINIANVNITVNGVDIAGKISAAEKLINNELIGEGRQMLINITKEYPEDYRAWFLLAKYAYQYDDIWFDDSSYFQKAKVLANDEGQKEITVHYDEMYSRILENSKTVLEFCENVDFTKLYYCYLKWYYHENYIESDRNGYWGFEPVNGCPTMVCYTKNDEYGYVRREIASDCKVTTKLHNKKIVGIITNENRCVRLPQNVKNQFKIDLGNGNYASRFDTCRIYITDFNGGKVIYNDNPSEMVYGNIFQSKSTDFKETGGGCYVATAVYGSYDCPEVWTLRRYRDNQLAKTWYGRLFIHIYYTISPTIVKWFGNTKWFKKMWKGNLDKMVKNLQSEGVESTPYEDKLW